MFSKRTVLSLAAVASAAAFMPLTFVSKAKTALSDIPDGWVGGFAETNPDYAYPPPAPDMSDLPILDNMENIDLLQRQQKVLWPQFSWLTKLGDPASRCYQMFAPDISRLGYTNEGRVYSIICPQQGFGTNTLGNLNVEVTVTGQRGWCDEPSHTVAADMSVMGQIWFSEGTEQNRLLALFAKILNLKGHFKMPFNKKNSIKVSTHCKGKPYQPLFALRNGTNQDFMIPPFAQHWEEAYGVAHLEVEIGPIIPEVRPGNEIVLEFNQLILDIFNLGSGNILKEGQILSWNVWFAEPELVDTEEWQNHAEVWRESLEVNHTSPTGDGVPSRFYDGTPFKPLKFALQQEFKLIKKFIGKHIADSLTGKLFGHVIEKLAEEEITELEKLLQQFNKYSKYSEMD